MNNLELRRHLLAGQVLPAHPLALDAQRKLDETHQRALTRYYVESGAGGIAVGVHTTQFAIRDHGLLEPVLSLASEGADTWLARTAHGEPVRPFVKIAGVVGRTTQAMREARLALDLGYDAGLLSLTAFGDASDDEMLTHAREIAEAIPIVGFYLQPAVGGRVLSFSFWRKFAEIKNVVAIKIAPFDRYFTLDVVRAVMESGRDDIALYTGNDDNIVLDLLTPFPVASHEGGTSFRYLDGGLLGHWAVWTTCAVQQLQLIRDARSADNLGSGWLLEAATVTEMNGAIFDVHHGFRGCIAGIHEVLRRQGLMRGTWCLDPNEGLSPGQADAIDRIARRYPTMIDDVFVAQHLDDWLA
ncbi:MAG: dihydrodipicolinate synthase family protein [Gemmatimonadota bacterium]|nr:dihydrodipicolinate synthase family protein [Gemmatimonadota bacterium]